MKKLYLFFLFTLIYSVSIAQEFPEDWNFQECQFLNGEIETFHRETFQDVYNQDKQIEWPTGYASTLEVSGLSFGGEQFIYASDHSIQGDSSVRIDLESEMGTVDLLTFIPCTEIPTRITGSYDFANSTIQDTFSVLVMHTKWDETDQERDTLDIFEEKFIGGTTGWQNFAVDFPSIYQGDTLTVFFYVTNEGQNETSFYLDDLNFYSYPLGVKPTVEGNFSIYPIPAKDEIFFKEIPKGDYQVDIIDMHGKNWYSNSFSTSVNIEHLPAGYYLIQIKGQDQIITEQLIKN